MRNVKINEAETIFEVFWEGDAPRGKGHAILDDYDQQTNGVATFSYSYWSTQTKLIPGLPQDHVPAVLERECLLDISEYDRMKMFAGIDKHMHFKMICCIDGVDTEVYNTAGRGERSEYVAEISGTCITKIRMEFRDTSGKGAISQIVWLGLSNSEKEHKMLAAKSPYTTDWPGLLADEPEMKPHLGLYFDEAELTQLREKVKRPEFANWMDGIRRSAQKAMQLVPENEVGKLVIRHDRRFLRDRDMERPVLYGDMAKLAFVGLVDGNEDMLKMACRIAMAVCHCEHFFESIMGVFPGVTWHHLCFTEASICENLVMTQDWAGGYLSPRGRNLIYNALLTKGLPIIDKVIKTDPDVWVCNQGLVFEESLITIMAALQKRWPRYASRLDEAEKDFFEMWENYVFQDGGSGEGSAYWDYTMLNTISALYMLARVRNKDIKDYVPELVKKCGDYATAMLADVGNGTLPINDSHPGKQFSFRIVHFLADIGAGDFWKIKSNKMLEGGAGNIVDLIRAKRFDVAGEPVREEYIHLPITGVTKVRRETEDMGIVTLHATSGAAIWGHAHKDKGSFVLSADNTWLLIDRGCCSYDNVYHVLIKNADVHNVLAAVQDGIIMNQGGAGSRYSGEILRAEYENGNFAYATDITAPWKGAFVKHVRNIASPNAYEYIITDEAELGTGDSVCFILNSYGEITRNGDVFVITDSGKQVTVTTENWKPTQVEMGLHGQDGNGKPVNRLCLYCGGSRAYKLITKLTLSKTE